jgi:hypothetical protein
VLPVVPLAVLIVIVMATGRYVSLERRTRRAWARVPVKKQVTKTPYRGETAPIVAGFYHRAPRMVRLASFLSSIYGWLYPLEAVLGSWGKDAEERKWMNAWGASTAMMQREPEAADVARRASEVMTLVQIVLGSIVFAFSPILISHPAIFAALGAFVLGGVVNAWLLARIARTYEAAFAAEAEAAPVEEKTARLVDEKEIPPWLARALERRAASRSPHVRIATSTSTSTSNADADANAAAEADAEAEANAEADAPARRHAAR